MSFHSKPITNILIFILSFFLACYISNSFNFIATSGWTGPYNLLIGYPAYIIVFIVVMVFLFFLFWNILNYIFYEENENSQDNEISHDTKSIKSKSTKIYTNKTVSKIPQRKNKTPSISKNTFTYVGSMESDADKNTKPTISSIVQNTFMYSLIIIGVVLALFFLIFNILKFSYGIKHSRNYIKSYHHHYQVSDYNDSRIIFYNKELERYTYSFMHASKKYDIFKSFAEQEIALQCIKILVHEHGAVNESNIVNKFKLNSRNKYQGDTKLLSRAEQNEKFITRYFTYPTTYIKYPIQYTIRKKIPNLCIEKVSVEKIYNLFIPQHIQLVSERIENLQNTMSTANNPNYTKRKINNLISWLNILYSSNPKNKKKEYKKYRFNAYHEYSRYGYDDSL